MRAKRFNIKNLEETLGRIRLAGPAATHLGFGILAVLWFATGLQAYRKIRNAEIEAHRQWMIRNFALTLAAVTLRNYMPLMLFALHWSFHVTYITVSWLCWVPNLLVAEWMIRGSQRAPTRQFSSALSTPVPSVVNRGYNQTS